MAACVRDVCRLHTADAICGLCGAITELKLDPSGQHSEYSSTETQQDNNKPSGVAESPADLKVIEGVADPQADSNNKAGAQVPDVVCSKSGLRDVQGVTQLNGDRPGHMSRTPRDDANINKSDSETREVPLSGSSEYYIQARETEQIQPLTKKKHTKQPNNDRAGMAPITTDSPCDGSSRHMEIARTVIRDMNKYGVCVIDKFLGPCKGVEILKDVLQLKDKEGAFSKGQVVRKKTEEIIRGDLITWVDGTESGTRTIGELISHIDAVISLCVGKLGGYNLHGRTSAMVACYPGGGRHYIRHIDNPNKDGRCITCIYYLNKNWNVKVDGGLLKIYPQGLNQVAHVEPLLDRLLFFWSDRRNPHEVLPAFKDRYAITVWYFDKEEREEARKRFKEQERSGEKLNG